MESEMKDKISKKMKEGWLKCWMMFEVLAVSEDATKEALEGHMKRLEQEKDFMIYDKKIGEMEKQDAPLPNVKEAFSQVGEIEVLVSNYDRLMTLVMNYGPSSVEILEPDEIKLTLDQAQGALNSVSAMMHKFASQSGGIVVST